MLGVDTYVFQETPSQRVTVPEAEVPHCVYVTTGPCAPAANRSPFPYVPAGVTCAPMGVHDEPVHRAARMVSCSDALGGASAQAATTSPESIASRGEPASVPDVFSWPPRASQALPFHRFTNAWFAAKVSGAFA